MDEDHKSRSQKKREDRALQELGEDLVGLPDEQLADIDMPEDLLEAVRFARDIKNHGARRRQMQRIGVLMRNIDAEPILKALMDIRRGHSKKVTAFKKIEKWRDELKAGNDELIEEILKTCPEAERQQLTQLVRNARKESEGGNGVKSSRALFRYLKQVFES